MKLELSDETFIAVDRPSVAAVLGDPQRWVDWWPDLELELLRDRGDKGRQWVLTGRVSGTAEIYLEPWHDGTIVHLFLRLEIPAPDPGATRTNPGAKPTAPEANRTDPGQALRSRTLSWKQTVHRLKDELEDGRAAGTNSQVGRRI